MRWNFACYWNGVNSNIGNRDGKKIHAYVVPTKRMN